MEKRRSDLRRKLRRFSDVRERLLDDPEMRDEWERTAVARTLALILVRYRTQHELSQTALAELLEMKQPAVARLESGDRAVTMDTLFHVLDVLGVPLSLEFAPGERTNVPEHASDDQIHESIQFRHGGRMEIVSG